MIKLQDWELNRLLNACEKIGVILDYVVFESSEHNVEFEAHKIVALAGMFAIDKRLEEWALTHTSEQFPIENFFRIKITSENISSERITFNQFWGSDICDDFVPEANGYKTAFFNPPYGLRSGRDEQKLLFNELNTILFSPCTDDNLDIYRWSNQWSNYFDAGKEWWGTFYWTIYNKEKSLFIVVGGSTTD